MIVNQIMKHVETGKLKTGDQLPSERELCKIFGVGRSSVREAIRALVVSGNLEVIQGKGTFLRDVSNVVDQLAVLENTLSVVPILDLMEAREILEIKAVRLAADRVDRADIQRIQAAINKMAASHEDIRLFYEADMEFHIALAGAADNMVISEMMKVIWKMVHKYRNRFMITSRDLRDKSISSAREILRLVARGEGEKAGEEMRRHLNDVDTNLKDMLSEAVKNDKTV